MGYARSQCLNYGYWHRDKVLDRSSIITKSQFVRAALACALGARITRVSRIARSRVADADAPRAVTVGSLHVMACLSLGRRRERVDYGLRAGEHCRRCKTQSSITVSVHIVPPRLSSLYDSYGRAGLSRSSAECYRAPATKHITLLATEDGR